MPVNNTSYKVLFQNKKKTFMFILFKKSLKHVPGEKRRDRNTGL